MTILIGVLVFIINILFYYTSFSALISIGPVLVLSLTTTLFEFIVFTSFDIKNKLLRLLNSLVYLTFSISKIFLAIYFRNYGNADIFSRSGQTGNLYDIKDYLLAQISNENFLIFSFTIVVAVLIFLNNGEKKDKIKTVFLEKKIYLMLSIPYILLAILVISTSNLEYYKLVVDSAYRSITSSDDDLLDLEEDMAVIEEVIDAEPVEEAGESEEKGKKKYKDLFKNYLHENEYTGIGKDKNLLVIQVESLQNSFIGKSVNGKELTPNLNKLIKKSFYFNNYFELLGFGNSSDAEYVSMHSAYSANKDGAYHDYFGSKVFGLPYISLSKGYTNMAMHNNSGTYYDRVNKHKSIGFIMGYYGENFVEDEVIGMGLSDGSFFKQALPLIEARKKAKTFTFMVTLTCHGPFAMPEEEQVFIPEDGKLDSDFDRYLNAVYYTDKVLGEFLSDLDEKGILKNTVVAIYGDHHAFEITNPDHKKDMSEFLGRKFDYDDMMCVPLIIYVPAYDKPVLVENVGSQLDFLPTILNIMGWNDTVTPMFGCDLLDEELSKDNVVYPQTYMLKGSYISDELVFELDRNDSSKGRLLNRKTREEDKNYDIDSLSKESKRVIGRANYIYLNDMVKDVLNSFREKNPDRFLSSDEAIMHMGGAIYGQRVGNVLEALEENYDLGKRIFELDFARTSDGRYVCIHGWDGFVLRHFDVDESRRKEVFSYDEFMNMNEKHGYTQMDIDRVLGFLSEHKDAKIITDTKGDNAEFLKILSERVGELKKNFIPQIYSYEEYEMAKGYGFGDIILTTYKGDFKADKVVRFNKKHKLYGITLMGDKVDEEEVRKLKKSGIYIYAATANDIDRARELLSMGVDRIYTDDL